MDSTNPSSPLALVPSSVHLDLIRSRRPGFGPEREEWERACDALLQAWEPTVRCMARRYAPAPSDIADFAQVARIALLRSASKFRGTSACRFENYARRSLRNALLNEAAHVSALKRRTQMRDEPARAREADECGLDHALREEARALVRQRVSRWVRRLRVMVEMLYEQDLSQAEAAGRLGLTPARVSQIVSEIRHRGCRELRDLSDAVV